MEKAIVIYGSSTGTTEDIAQRIANALNISEVVNVCDLNDDLVNSHDVLILGSSTWGAGDLQDDWYDGIEVLKNADLSNKTIALFGCGNSVDYSDTFCNAIGDIYNELKDSGATFIGAVDASDYTYDDSESVIDGKFIGLAIDEDNESDKTDARIKAWANQIDA